MENNENAVFFYLSDALVGSLHAGANALGRFVSELDGHLRQKQHFIKEKREELLMVQDLQEADGELGVHLGGHPEAERVVHEVCLDQQVHRLSAERQRQVDVLHQNPAPVQHRILDQPPRRHLLTLTHRHRLQL
jgi:hypothetical protein